MPKVEMQQVDDVFQADPPLVLVVDDEVLIRLFAGDMLRDAGFAVVEAGNADEAMTLLATGTRFSVVFSDVNMPGSTDGIGLAGHVRENYPDIPVVLTSGRVQAPELTRAGAVAVVPKPYTQAVLTRAIGTVLSKAND